MKTLRIVGLLCCAFAMSANATLLRSVDVESAPGTNGSWSFGSIFTVGANDLAVTSLGAYDYMGDGFVSGAIKVGLFDEALGTLLAATNVTSSDTLLGTYRYSALNYDLLAGHQYRLVAVSAADKYIQGAEAWTYASDVTMDGFAYCSTSLLTRCNAFTESDYGMANMQFNRVMLPEPATLLTFALGLTALFLVRRKPRLERTPS